MLIKLIVIEKTKADYLQAAEADYLKRLKHFGKLQYEVIELPKKFKSLAPEQLKQKESQAILDKLQNDDHVVLLDEKGKQYSSRKFAQQISQWQNRSIKQLCFIVGGAFGFDDSVYQRANDQLRLSDMTFSHQMIRCFFFEQLYRAFTIINNHPYHND